MVISAAAADTSGFTALDRTRQASTEPSGTEAWARSGAWPPRAQTGEGENSRPLADDHAA